MAPVAEHVAIHLRLKVTSAQQQTLSTHACSNPNVPGFCLS